MLSNGLPESIFKGFVKEQTDVEKEGGYLPDGRLLFFYGYTVSLD